MHHFTVTGESMSSDKIAAEKLQNEFEELINIEQFPADQIYNADESNYSIAHCQIKL